MMLMPAAGLPGAVAAYVASRFLDGSYLAWRTVRLYGIHWRQLASWADQGRVGLATAIAAVPVYAFDWTHALGIVGVVPAVLLFAATFAVSLRALRLPEAIAAFQRLRQPLGARP